jgi:thioredoxin-like negative regulator of GroEL
MLNMRRYISCLFAHLVLAFAGSKADMHWKPESSAAWSEATQSAHPVLVEVWADWCPPCKQMDQDVWSNARVIEAANKFVQISVDASRRDRAQIGGIILGKYGIHMVKALPTAMLLDPWGETLTVLEGYVHPADMAAMLAQIPADYGAVRAEREALLSHRDNSRALASVGLLYQRSSALGIANRYFKEALSGSGAKEDERQREQLMFGIATNELRLADWKAARKHLEEFRAAFPGSALLDQVLFGFVVADVRQNKIKDAQRRAAELRSAFPNSKMVAEVDRLLEEHR